MIFTKWLEKRKKRIVDNQYNKGYDYAAGALLRGEETPISIESHYYYSDWSPFDRGADDASGRLIKLGIVKDDTI